MNITRHNYEECFILYMDNELSSDDRRMVEDFIQHHPDLKEELDLLQQFKLAPDTSIVFTGKEELLMPVLAEHSLINLSNYEEWLVLYADKELKPEQRKAVAAFIAGNPLAKKELALIQRSTLPAEKIIFPDKELLYRKEEKVRKIPVRWWRIAAAVILLLSTGITTVLIINNKKSADERPTVARIGGEEKKGIAIPVLIPEKISPGKKEAVVINKDFKQTLQPGSKQPATTSVAATTRKNKVIDKLPANIPVQKKDDQQSVAKDNNIQDNRLPKPLNNPNINKTEAIDHAIVDHEPKKTANPADALTNVDVTNQGGDSYNSKNADNSIVNTNFDESSKNKKNRGFFRKLARTFEKRTNIDPTDDGKLLVGGLAIKLR